MVYCDKKDFSGPSHHLCPPLYLNPGLFHLCHHLLQLLPSFLLHTLVRVSLPLKVCDLLVSPELLVSLAQGYPGSCELSLFLPEDRSKSQGSP